MIYYVDKREFPQPKLSIKLSRIVLILPALNTIVLGLHRLCNFITVKVHIVYNESEYFASVGEKHTYKTFVCISEVLKTKTLKHNFLLKVYEEKFKRSTRILKQKINCTTVPSKVCEVIAVSVTLQNKNYNLH